MIEDGVVLSDGLSVPGHAVDPRTDASGAVEVVGVGHGHAMTWHMPDADLEHDHEREEDSDHRPEAESTQAGQLHNRLPKRGNFS